MVNNENVMRLSTQMQKLNSKQLRAFRTIFDEFDLEDSGTLTADELHRCINHLAGYQAISFSDVMKLLTDLDVKSTGDIEFDEFIYFMTKPQNMEKMLTDEDRKQIEDETGMAVKHLEDSELDEDKRAANEIFFNILQQVLERELFKDIRTFYRQEIQSKMDDHVINDWCDGIRCIGLSNEAMMKRYDDIEKKFKKDVSFKDKLMSPYALPNKWGVNELRKDIERQKIEVQKSLQQKLEADRSVLKAGKKVKHYSMEVPLPVYQLKKWGRQYHHHQVIGKNQNEGGKVSLKKWPIRFTYDHLRHLNENVSNLNKNYYGNVKVNASTNSYNFYYDSGIDKQLTLAFKSYCNPFVISPWVPSVNPTYWKQTKHAPIGRPVPKSVAART